MEESLYQVKGEGESLLKDRGSKFYGYAFPVLNLAEVETHLQMLKKQYYDARHHCYAYRLGTKGETTFSTDDREPANSAGPPILAAIRSAQLTDVLVVVVRYFGGTKLGLRGLIEAYRETAAVALAKVPKKLIIPQIIFEISYPYEQTSRINRLLHPFKVDTVEAVYTDSCLQQLAIHEKDFPRLASTFAEAGISIKEISSP